ncbi:MAG: hypothetical protein HOL01_08405 [Planctomycetaceae bacterium]|jgi:uncharacterized protein|nr:hypothetical protein [Planctomycetaceae bacterium]MBT6487783.1 hypothetical protein [Planctomycetaceae bacterium]MBT6494555.1 hypothetical protein [Planctomycetaceae bacterium]
MSMAKGALRSLHQLHLELQEVHDKLGQGPRQIEARKKIVVRRQEELKKQGEQKQQLKMSADEKTLQLKTNEGKISELKVKLNTCSSNREFDIFRSQIDADEMANSVLEDEILEAFERVDGVQDAIGVCEQDLQAAHDEEARLAKAVADAAPGLQSEADRLEGSLAEAERELPSRIMEQYRRLVQAHGADSLAAVEGKICTSCHTHLSANEGVELNMGKVAFCRSCGRLLYRGEK